MATYSILYELHEVEVDKNDEYVREHVENLPHADYITKEFCESWNKGHDLFLKLINKECDNRIASCKMRRYKKNSPKATLAIDFKAVPGKQLTSWIKNEIADFVSAQMSDGWGESRFGLINVMEVNGTRFYAD